MTEIYRDNLRFYQVNNQEYPSITSVIGAVLAKKRILNWAVSQTIKYIKEQNKLTPEVLSNAYKYHTTYLNELAETGTAKHKMVEEYLTKKVVVKDKFLDKFIAWEKAEDFRYKYSEQFVYSDKLKVAGRVDLIGYLHNIPFIVDLKSSSSIQVSHKIQICGYRAVIGKPIKVGILRISRDGSSKTWYVLTNEEIREYTLIFLHLLSAFHKLYKLGGLK